MYTIVCPVAINWNHVYSTLNILDIMAAMEFKKAIKKT